MASDVARIYLVTDVLDNYKAIASKVKKQAKEAAKDAKIDLGIDIKDNEIEKALASINKRLGEKTFKEVNFSNITTSFFSDLVNPEFDAETKKDLIINFNRFIKNIRPDMVAEINNLGEEESHKVLENIFSIFSTKNAEKYFGQSGAFTKIGKENLQSEFDAIINKYSIDFNKRIQSNVFSQIFSDENYKKELNGVKKYLEDSETLIESFINSYMKYANLGTTSSLQDMMGITAVYQNFTGDKALKGVYDFITKEEKLTERQKELANEFKTAIRDDLFLNPDEEITKDIFKGFIDEQIVPNFEDTYVKSIVKKAKKLGQKMAEERDKIIKEQLEYQGAIEQANKDNPEQEVVYKDLEHFERERDALGRFKQAVVDVTDAINKKTQAIIDEESQMESSVQNEINILDNLLLKVNELQDKLTNDFKIKINTELDNIDLNGALNNIFESLTKIPQNIKEGNYSEVSSGLSSVADIIQSINEANEYILNYSSFIDNQNIPLENKDMRFANRRNLKERALYWNKNTGEYSNPFIYDQAGGVGGDFLKALRESGKYTSYLHTHPVKYAVPSGADFKSFAKEFEMGIEEDYIASLDEIFEFNIKEFRKKASKYDLINISKLIEKAIEDEVYKEDPYYKENHKDILGQDIFNRLKEGTKANGYNLNNLSQDAKTVIKNDETLIANIGKETANFISENLSTILEHGLQNLNAQNFDKSTWGKTIPRIIEEYVLEANNNSSLNVDNLRNNIKKSKVNSFLSEIFSQTRGELFFEGERNLFEEATRNMERQIISDYLKKKDIKLDIDDIWKTYSYDEFFKAHPELQGQKDFESTKKENKKTETIDVKIDNITLSENSIQEIITKIQDELKNGEFLLEINNLSLSEEAKGNFIDSIKSSLDSQSIAIDKINISPEAISSSLQSSELNSGNNLKIDNIQTPFVEKEGFTSMNNSIQTIKEVLNLIEELQYTNDKGFFNKLPKELPEGDKNIEELKKQYEQYIEYYESIAQLNKIIKKENFSEEQRNVLYGVINDGRVSRMSLEKVEARIAEYKQNYLKLFNTRKDSENVEIPTDEINKNINNNKEIKLNTDLSASITKLEIASEAINELKEKIQEVLLSSYIEIPIRPDINDVSLFYNDIKEGLRLEDKIIIPIEFDTKKEEYFKDSIKDYTFSGRYIADLQSSSETLLNLYDQLKTFDTNFIYKPSSGEETIEDLKTYIDFYQTLIKQKEILKGMPENEGADINQITTRLLKTSLNSTRNNISEQENNELSKIVANAENELGRLYDLYNSQTGINIASPFASLIESLEKVKSSVQEINNISLIINYDEGMFAPLLNSIKDIENSITNIADRPIGIELYIKSDFLFNQLENIQEQINDTKYELGLDVEKINKEKEQLIEIKELIGTIKDSIYSLENPIEYTSNVASQALTDNVQKLTELKTKIEEISQLINSDNFNLNINIGNIKDTLNNVQSNINSGDFNGALTPLNTILKMIQEAEKVQDEIYREYNDSEPFEKNIERGFLFNTKTGKYTNPFVAGSDSSIYLEQSAQKAEKKTSEELLKEYNAAWHSHPERKAAFSKADILSTIQEGFDYIYAQATEEIAEFDVKSFMDKYNSSYSRLSIERKITDNMEKARDKYTQQDIPNFGNFFLAQQLNDKKNLLDVEGMKLNTSFFDYIRDEWEKIASTYDLNEEEKLNPNAEKLLSQRKFNLKETFPTFLKESLASAYSELFTKSDINSFQNDLANNDYLKLLDDISLLANKTKEIYNKEHGTLFNYASSFLDDFFDSPFFNFSDIIKEALNNVTHQYNKYYSTPIMDSDTNREIAKIIDAEKLDYFQTNYRDNFIKNMIDDGFTDFRDYYKVYSIDDFIKAHPEYSESSQITQNSISQVGEEANKFDQLQISALQASEAKQAFVEANKNVSSSVEGSVSGIEEEGEEFKLLAEKEALIEKIVSSFTNEQRLDFNFENIDGFEGVSQYIDVLENLFQLREKLMEQNGWVDDYDTELVNYDTNLEMMYDSLRRKNESYRRNLAMAGEAPPDIYYESYDRFEALAEKIDEEGFYSQARGPITEFFNTKYIEDLIETINEINKISKNAQGKIDSNLNERKEELMGKLGSSFTEGLLFFDDIDDMDINQLTDYLNLLENLFQLREKLMEQNKWDIYDNEVINYDSNLKHLTNILDSQFNFLGNRDENIEDRLSNLRNTELSPYANPYGARQGYFDFESAQELIEIMKTTNNESNETSKNVNEVNEKVKIDATEIINNITDITNAIQNLENVLGELRDSFQSVFVFEDKYENNGITNLTEKLLNIRSLLESISGNIGMNSVYNDYVTNNNYSSGLDSEQFNAFIIALSEMYELIVQVQEAWNQGFETKSLEGITNTFDILTQKIDGVILKIGSLAETLGKIDASKITISDDKQIDKKGYTQQQRILAKQIKEITKTEREYQELKNRINDGETLTSFNDIYKYNKEKALREDLARKQKDVAYDEAFNSKYIESLMQAKRQNEREVSRALREFNVKANQQNQFEEKEQSINKVIDAIKILIDTELEYQKLNKEWNTNKDAIEKDSERMNRFIDLGKKRNEATTILNSQEAIDVSDDDRVIDAIIEKRGKEIAVDTSLDLEEIRKKEIEEEKILNAKAEAQKQADLESQKQIQTTLDFYDRLIATEQEYQTLLLKRKNSELTVEEQRKMASLEKDRLTKVLTQEEAKKMGLTQEEAEKAVGYDYYANTPFGKNIFTSSVVQQKANDYLQIRDNIETDVLEKERLSNILNTINEIKKAYAEYSTLITKQVISGDFISTSDLKRLNELKEILGAIVGEANGVDSLGVALNNLINSGQGNTKNVNGFINGMNKYLEAVDETSLGKLYETYGGTEKEYQKLMAKQVYTKNLDTESSGLTVNEQNELIRLETKRSFLLDEINKREAMSVDLSAELVQKRADLVSLESSYAKSYNEAWQNKKGDELQTPYDQINELQRLVTTSDGKYIATDEYKTKLSDLRKEADSLKETLKTIDYGNPESVENFSRSLDNLKIKVKDAKNELKNFQSKDATKLMRNIAQFLEKNHGISEESRNTLQEYYKEIEDGSNLSIGRVRELGQAVTEIIAKETMAGNVGMTFFDTLNQRAKGLLATLMTYVSFYRIIGYIKQGFNTFKQFDSALAEMQKVSNETISTLKNFQQASFDLADSIGTDALSLQQSVAEFMRLGQSLEEATDSAQAANILFNVSEFESAKDASTALIAMSQAYDELSNTQIIDVINKLGNDFPISTEGLATALQDGAASLTTAGNDFYEAAALVTAGNRITQDPSKVGKAMRTIALRLTGTEASAEELEADGEEVEGMIKNVSKLRDVIMQATKVDSNNNKGIDILNDVGAYKSTYDILLEIAEIYDEIVEKDKQYGTKQANLLLETIAGKNRASIAASILQSPDMLKEAYAEATDAEGSAAIENEKYMDSIEGHLVKLKNAWEELWANVSTREFVNGVIDLGTGILQIVNNLGLVKSALLAIGALDIIKWMTSNSDGKKGSLFNGFINSLRQFNTKGGIKGLLSGGVEGAVKGSTGAVIQNVEEATATEVLEEALSGAAGDSVVEGTKEGIFKGLASSGIGKIVGNIGSSITSLLPIVGYLATIAGIIGTGYVIFKGISKAIDKANFSLKETREEAKALVSDYQTSQKNSNANKAKADELSDRYVELSKGVNLSNNQNLTLTNEEYSEYLSICNDIANMYPRLVSGYDAQGNAILKLKGNVEQLTEAYKQEQMTAARTLIQGGENGEDARSIWDDFQNYKTLERPIDDREKELLDSILSSPNAKGEVNRILENPDYNTSTSYNQPTTEKEIQEAFAREKLIELGFSINMDDASFDETMNKLKTLTEETEMDAEIIYQQMKTMGQSFAVANEKYWDLDETQQGFITSAINGMDKETLLGLKSYEDYYSQISNLVDSRL